MEIKKYPRTYHLPFSAEVHKDDKTIDSENLINFIEREVVITEKLDGGNTQLNNGLVFARTNSSVASHPSFDPIKKMYYENSYQIPNNVAVFGENLYGIHSIEYDNLDSFFYVFNILKEDVWLSWDEVELFAKTYNFKIVPVLFRGKFKSLDEIKFWMEKEIKSPSALGKEREGFVIRIADSFSFDDFSKNAAKYVRNGHVQTNERWEKNWRKAKLNI